MRTLYKSKYSELKKVSTDEDISIHNKTFEKILNDIKDYNNSANESRHKFRINSWVENSEKEISEDLQTQFIVADISRQITKQISINLSIKE